MHEHAGRSSARFFSPHELLDHLDLQEDMQVLDAGAGDGHIAIALSYMVDRVYALEKDRQTLGKLKAKAALAPNVVPMLGDANNLPFPDKSMDMTLLVNVLHGFVANDEQTAIEEIRRVSKRIVVVEFRLDADDGPPKEVRLSPKDIEKIYGKSKKFDLATHYGLIFDHVD